MSGWWNEVLQIALGCIFLIACALAVWAVQEFIIEKMGKK